MAARSCDKVAAPSRAALARLRVAAASMDRYLPDVSRVLRPRIGPSRTAGNTADQNRLILAKESRSIYRAN